MMVNRESETFQTIISLQTRIEAEKFRCYQSQTSKAKQVYLNTLAVSAVNLYLNSIGWSTDIKGSDSWNPVLQTMMNVADLQVPSYGKLECRFVLNGHDTVTIPPEVWSGRIGYIVVRLNQSLDRATLLGFVRRVSQTELPLSQLESLTQFPAYLSQQKRAAPIPITTISKWFSGQLDRGWQKIEELFAPGIALNFRSSYPLASQIRDRLSSEVNRVKLVRLGENSDVDVSVALVLSILPKSDRPSSLDPFEEFSTDDLEDISSRSDNAPAGNNCTGRKFPNNSDRFIQSLREFDISVAVCNAQFDNYLPEGLDLIISDENSRPVMIAQANQTQTIEFCFSGKLGETFSIELALEEQIAVESFII